jgi:hypothetical protein
MLPDDTRDHALGVSEPQTQAHLRDARESAFKQHGREFLRAGERWRACSSMIALIER